MSVQIICCDDGLNATERRKWAAKVLDRFADLLPDLRLLVYLDSKDWSVLKERARSEDNRGAFDPINEDYYNSWEWPDDVQHHLVAVDELTLQTSFKFDAIVYLHASTCTSQESLIMTLSHELQHFIQYGVYRELWAWNKLLFLAGNEVAQLGFRSHDIPSEADARIVAKAASQVLIGHQKTDAYIARRHNEARSPDDRADWAFVSKIDTTLPFDYATETKRFYQRLQPIRSALADALDRARSRTPDLAARKLEDMLQA
jgi:hypothetical protein